MVGSPPDDEDLAEGPASVTILEGSAKVKYATAQAREQKGVLTRLALAHGVPLHEW